MTKVEVNTSGSREEVDMRFVIPQLRPEIRKEGAGAAVPDPCKTKVNGCLDEVAASVPADPHPHISALSEETRARLAGEPATAVAGETFTLLVEVRLTKHALGGERSRRITADVVQALLDRSVADHAVAMHAQGEQPKVAGFTVRLIEEERG